MPRGSLGRRVVAAALAVLVAAGFVFWVTRSDPSIAVPGGPVGFVALEDGGFIFGERTTGTIRRADADGNLLSNPVAEIDVAGPGLLGIAIDLDQRVFAAWVTNEGRLTVGQVAPGPPRVVWSGPDAEVDHVGGVMAAAPDGSIAIAIGDLSDPAAVTDRTTSNGKVLAIDPNDDPDQRPLILSSGWVDPVGIDYLPNGELWVADRRGGLIARGDLGELEPFDTVGTDLTALGADGPGGLLLCVGGEVVRYAIEEDGTSRRGETLADGCGPAVTALTDRIAFASDDAIYLVEPPD